MTDKMILLGFWASPFSTRAKIALEEKGVDHEYREEDLWNNRSPLLLSSNPIYKKIPVLIHNAKPLCESLIILQYIDEVWEHQSPKLLPKDPHQRAKARFWADFIDKKMLVSGWRLWTTKGDSREAAEELIVQLKMLEVELGEKQNFGGEIFGFTDIALMSCAHWLKVYEIEGKFSMEDECPKLKAWVERCEVRESVAKNIPDVEKVCDYVLFVRKRLGLE